ncbi:MAG TPA: histidine phosphotransferase family protein [Acetobacteraceae bacterium]|nr:histidine phosphotransferase family protein [Acetobacteraceae bacterium]
MASTRKALRLAEYTCARLCHELSGLIGSLDGALEMLLETLPADNEPLDLARGAAADAIQRLKLLRAAWGPEGEALSVPAIERLAGGLPGARRLAIRFIGVPQDTVFEPPIARMVLNLLLLAGDSLPAGGEIVVTGSPSDLFLGIAGPGAAWPVGLALCLADEAAAFDGLRDARTIQMPLTVLLARGLGLRLSLLMTPDSRGGVPPLRLTGD